MEPKIREIVANGKGGNTLISAGFGHFYGKYENNLYERLRDLNPKRIRLVTVDKF